ncbi:MAG: phosphate:Na+ symporter [Bacillota bacterium]|nr:phosphate:Na+ symporter [Bacillota bacterium]MDK2881671.1 phosphate:Na+ symporter [Bacillota bacterium]MDK2959878.1 phosphate:Na+ symporter [Bacillota bacterium]
MTGVIGGVALFLFGIQLLGEGLQKAVGKRLRRVLEHLTGSVARGAFVGCLITAVVQSSSATTVLTVTFVDAGLLSLRQAIGVILGANVGTTVTAQLVALDLEFLAGPAVFLGAFLFFSSRFGPTRELGRVIFGFGLLFAGMGLMSRYLSVLSAHPFFPALIRALAHSPGTAVLAGACVTGIFQSSSVVIAMVIALADQGAIDLKGAIGFVLGSNIGTTVTALLASIGTGMNARRAAAVHFIFNVLGVLAIFPFFAAFGQLVACTSPDLPRQVANAHTLFNLLTVILCLPFAGILERLVITLMPGG